MPEPISVISVDEHPADAPPLMPQIDRSWYGILERLTLPSK